MKQSDAQTEDGHEQHQDSRVRVTRNRWRSGKLIVKQSSVVSWEVAGSQAVKKYSVVDLGQDPPVLCLQLQHNQCQTVCFLGATSATQRSGEKSILLSRKRTQLKNFQRVEHVSVLLISLRYPCKVERVPASSGRRCRAIQKGEPAIFCFLFFVVFSVGGVGDSRLAEKN